MAEHSSARNSNSSNSYADYAGDPQLPADADTRNAGGQLPADEEPGYYSGHDEDRFYSDTVPPGSLNPDKK